MKKMFLTLVAAGAMMFTAQTASAQVTGEEREAANQEMQQQQQQQQDFQQIETSEVPDAINQAVERDFQGSTVSEAYSKDKDGQTHYRIVLTTDNGETRELYADEQGNWIDKDGNQK